MRRRIQEIPYRGQPRPKLYGHPSRPKPYQRFIELVFWFVFIIVGIVIFWTAITASPQNYGGFFGFAIYLIFLFIAIFAFRDAKRFRVITPDEDIEREENGEINEDSRLLAEEAPDQIESEPSQAEQHPSHHRHPKWRDRPIKTISNKVIYRIKNDNFSQIAFIGLMMVGLVASIVAAVIFGITSPITFIFVTVIFLVFLTVYLIRE